MTIVNKGFIIFINIDSDFNIFPSMKQQLFPQRSKIIIQKRGVSKRVFTVNHCFILVTSSQIDIAVTGNKNRIKIDQSAGKISIIGNQNQIQLTKSWITAKIQGNQNIFNLIQSQFLLQSHQGQLNIIPGILGDMNGPIQRRLYHQRMLGNIRLNKKQKTQNIKKIVSMLAKSLYNSQVRQCSICYDDIKQGDEITSLFCFHYFHSYCIEAFLQTSTKCPVCSLDLLKAIHQQLKSGYVVPRNGEWILRQSMDQQIKQDDKKKQQQKETK